MGGRSGNSNRNNTSSVQSYIDTWKAQETEAVVEEMKQWRERALKWKDTEPFMDRVALERQIPVVYYNAVKGVKKYPSEEAENKAFHAVAKQLIDDHFEALRDKVEQKIGKITRIDNIGGANNYDLTGESGQVVRVQVVMAGGYNKQRIHTRWIQNKLGKRGK